jgi:hypothetical protein
MFLAFHEQASVFGQGFNMLRLTIEHEEAGLHTVAEVIALSEHPEDATAARIVLSSRIKAFEPRPGEDEEAYRQRLAPIVGDEKRIETHRQQFESLVQRMADAVRKAMPTVRVEVREAEAKIQKPERRPKRRKAVSPLDHRYDPYDRYYYSPMDTIMSFMMWNAIFHMAMPPHVTVVDHHGDSIGSAQDISHEASAGDFGDAGGTDFGGDAGDFDSGGGFDFGGFDGFGGFD